jgi:hypothetical protein
MCIWDTLLAFWLPIPELGKLLSLPIGVVAAWCWWSYQVPKWRLWALQYVADFDTLHHKAVAFGIEWPYGHFLAATEIKSPHQRRQEATLLLRYYLQRTDHIFTRESCEPLTHNYRESVAHVLPNLQESSPDQHISPNALALIEQRLRELIVAQPTFYDRPSLSILAGTLHSIHAYQHATAA